MSKSLIDKLVSKHQNPVDNKLGKEVVLWVQALGKLLFSSSSDKISVQQVQASISAQKNLLVSALKQTDSKQQTSKSEKIAQQFTDSLQQIYKMLELDLQAKFGQVEQYSIDEIFDLYPQFKNILHYRLSHWFYKKGQKNFAHRVSKIVNEGHGICITECCQIGSGLVLAGNQNIQISQTAKIGNNCKIYGGVIIGGINKSQNKQHKSHQIIQDNVTIYSGASILGENVLVGEGSVIGPNATVSESVLPNSYILITSEPLVARSLQNKFSIEAMIGNTPLVEVRNIFKHPNVKIFAKLQGQNPGGSVKDRPAYNMIKQALKRGDIKPGMKLIEPTSGNTGIALAMIACIFNLDIQLVMPENSTAERVQTMEAYGAKVILTPASGGIQGSRDYAQAQVAKGGYKMLNQFANTDNYMAHYYSTGPEIWRDTKGTVTHFVSSMGTTGTIMGTSMFLKQKSSQVQIVGVQPTQGSKIPGIRRWTPEYLPKIFNKQRVDKVIDVSEEQSLIMMRRMAKQEAIFAGMSSGGAMAAAIKLAQTLEKGVIVTIVCDRGDRYLSSGIFANQSKP